MAAGCHSVNRARRLLSPAAPAAERVRSRPSRQNSGLRGEKGYAGHARERLTSVQMARTDEPITIKGYANRRLYHTGSGTDVTLTDLAGMVEDDEDFVVLDAAIGADI